MPHLAVPDLAAAGTVAYWWRWCHPIPSSSPSTTVAYCGTALTLGGASRPVRASTVDTSLVGTITSVESNDKHYQSLLIIRPVTRCAATWPLDFELKLFLSNNVRMSTATARVYMFNIDACLLNMCYRLLT